MSELPFVIFIMGPTATGKTDLAIYLHERINSEIISVDSAMVYRGLDIGTAKPSKELLKKFPHHLVNVCDPAEIYSAARFQQDAYIDTGTSPYRHYLICYFVCVEYWHLLHFLLRKL